MSDHPAIPTADAVETFVASLCQRSVPKNTIKSYAHDLHLFMQAVPADLAAVTPEKYCFVFTSYPQGIDERRVVFVDAGRV